MPVPAPYPRPARLAAALLAAVAWGAVAAQLPLTAAEFDLDLAAAALRLLGFFTILTALLTGLAMAMIAAGRRVGGFVLGGLTLYEVFLGGVYYALLARHRDLAGSALIVDTALHAVLPAGMLLFWWRFAPKAGLRARDAMLWALWPALYSAAALLRGAVTGWYPYFFLDVGRFGPASVALQVAGLTACLALLGLGLALLGRRLAATDPPAKL